MDARYEVKFCCEEHAYSEVLSELRMCTGMRPLHPARRVQSIYLDTHSGRALQDNLAGISDREKIRFRWYGDHMDRAQGQLERKIRSNMLGTKEVAKLTHALDLLGQGRQAFVRKLIAEAPPSWRPHLDAGLEPAQWVTYERDYFTSPDGRIRITMDRDLRTYDLRYRPAIDRVAQAVPARILVIEFKADADEYAALRKLVSKTSLRADRCSKFVLASAPGHGPVPSRFFW